MTDTIDFIGELHHLITAYSSGTVTSGQAPSSASVEPHGSAQRTLDSLLEQLVTLAGPPIPGTPFTLTFAGGERHDGEAPYSWVVSADTLDSARLTLAQLPTFQQFLEEERDEDGVLDVVFVQDPLYSHPGIPEWGAYTDLRREQAERLGPTDAPHAHRQLPS